MERKQKVDDDDSDSYFAEPHPRISMGQSILGIQRTNNRRITNVHQYSCFLNVRHQKPASNRSDICVQHRADYIQKVEMIMVISLFLMSFDRR